MDAAGQLIDPPTLWNHGDKDGLVKLKQSVQIYEGFQNTGATTGMYMNKGAGHGFKGGDDVRATKALIEWYYTGICGN